MTESLSQSTPYFVAILAVCIVMVIVEVRIMAKRRQEVAERFRNRRNM